MKRVLLTVLLAGSTYAGLHAQKLEKARSLLKNDKLNEAVNEINNFLAIEKNAANADAWFTKSKIYLALAKTKEGAEKNAAMESAEESIMKYLDLQKDIKDSTKKNLMLIAENSATLAELYSNYSQAGASFYNSGNFKDAFVNFDKGLNIVSVMYENGLTDIALDTTGRLFAGISAEKANLKDEAAKQYNEIVKHRATGDDFDQIYKWVVEYYAGKDDEENLFKTIAIGKEVFPNDEWWDLFELEFYTDRGEFDRVYDTYEKLIAAKPEESSYKFNYAITLYENNYLENVLQRPAGWQEKLEKAEKLFKEFPESDKNYVSAQLMIGQLIYNKGVDKANENREIRPEQGKRLTPEQQKQKDDLKAQTAALFDQALPYFEKVTSLLEPKGKLEPQEKAILKSSLDITTLIYEDKLLTAETKQADLENKKQAAAAKAMDAEIKKLREKVDALTLKYNNVDKDH